MPVYGGQAVIEGVMMRSRSSAATAVRTEGGSIAVRDMPLARSRFTQALRRIPVARGIAALWDVFALGTRALAYSARMATVEPGAEEVESDRADFWTKAMMAFGLCLGVALFFMAPLGIAALLDRWIESSTASNLLEGLVRIAIVIGYLAAISLLPDIYRTLQYHGAEHKTVNAVESQVPLTPENVISQSRFHPRCGTSFPADRGVDFHRRICPAGATGYLASDWIADRDDSDRRRFGVRDDYISWVPSAAWLGNSSGCARHLAATIDHPAT